MAQRFHAARDVAACLSVLPPALLTMSLRMPLRDDANLVDRHAALVARLPAMVAARRRVGTWCPFPSGKPISRRWLGEYVAGAVQCGQIVRTSRCARNARTVLESRNGSMPMSSRRVMPPTASFVCSVEKTRCPVSAARMAMSAVSPSRISPTMMTFGSCRKMCRRPLAKLNPISGFTSICDTPGSRYSTGSSMVMMRRCTELMLVRKL